VISEPSGSWVFTTGELVNIPTWPTAAKELATTLFLASAGGFLVGLIEGVAGDLRKLISTRRGCFSNNEQLPIELLGLFVVGLAKGKSLRATLSP
jgi:hypothetical protein